MLEICFKKINVIYTLKNFCNILTDRYKYVRFKQTEVKSSLNMVSDWLVGWLDFMAYQPL